MNNPHRNALRALVSLARDRHLRAHRRPPQSERYAQDDILCPKCGKMVAMLHLYPGSLDWICWNCKEERKAIRVSGVASVSQSEFDNGDLFSASEDFGKE